MTFLRKLLESAPWIAAIIFGLLFTYQCNQEPSVRIETDTVRVTTIDTAFIEKLYPIEVVRYIDRPMIREKEVINEDTFNLYSDTTFIEPDYYLFYNAKVQGLLNGIELGYYDNRPEQIITVTNTETVTNNIHHDPSGIYVGAHVSTSMNIVPSIMYMKNRVAFSAGYDLSLKSIHVGGYYRITKPP